MARERFREETATGRCPTHGEVKAVKEVPNVSFPFIVWGIRRVRSALQGYRCPQCGDKVTIAKPAAD